VVAGMAGGALEESFSTLGLSPGEGGIANRPAGYE
jgi:hypothetical protein